MKEELQRRKSNVEKLSEFFMAHPGVWINAVELEPIAGRQAWRTRVSELRLRLEKLELGTIINRQRRAISLDKHPDAGVMYLGPIISEYMFRPKPLGRDAGEKIQQRSLF